MVKLAFSVLIELLAEPHMVLKSLRDVGKRHEEDKKKIKNWREKMSFNYVFSIQRQ